MAVLTWSIPRLGGFCLGVKRHAVSFRDLGRVRAGWPVKDLAVPVPDHFSGEMSGQTGARSPVPRRDRVRIGPEPAFGVPRFGFEVTERRVIRGVFLEPPRQGSERPSSKFFAGSYPAKNLELGLTPVTLRPPEPL